MADGTGTHDNSECQPQKCEARDGFAGLHGFATFGGLISSRHRGACRSVITGVRVVLSVVSSIRLLSIPDFTLAFQSFK